MDLTQYMAFIIYLCLALGHFVHLASCLAAPTGCCGWESSWFDYDSVLPKKPLESKVDLLDLPSFLVEGWSGLH